MKVESPEVDDDAKDFIKLLTDCVIKHTDGTTFAEHLPSISDLLQHPWMVRNAMIIDHDEI